MNSHSSGVAPFGLGTDGVKSMLLTVSDSVAAVRIRLRSQASSREDQNMATITEDRGALRPDGVARWLSCSRDTVDRMIQAGALKSFTVGRARYISVRELERFISDRENGGAS